jgi:hypothetical protein
MFGKQLLVRKLNMGGTLVLQMAIVGLEASAVCGWVTVENTLVDVV